MKIDPGVVAWCTKEAKQYKDAAVKETTQPVSAWPPSTRVSRFHAVNHGDQVSSPKSKKRKIDQVRDHSSDASAAHTLMQLRAAQIEEVRMG